MAKIKLHADEIDIDEALVRKLIKSQFPQWQKLKIKAINSGGTSNSLYKLGTDKVIRLPRTKNSTEHMVREQRWLPYLAPQLPFKTPVPLAKGKPAKNYPWPWAIYNWIEGENAFMENIRKPIKAVHDMAQFINNLQKIDTTDGPVPGFDRGISLKNRDKPTREAISLLKDKYDPNLLTEIWESSLQIPEWENEPVWIHADLHAGNILAKDGKITAIIDFGGVGVGDPAGDLLIAWNLFSKELRREFRKLLGTDDFTWLRGRGWAFSMALIALPYYLNTNPLLTRIADYTIKEVIRDL